MSGSHLSKEFFELVKSIGESKSKQEEDRIIQHEVATLKRKLQDPSGGGTGASEKKKKKEFLIRLLYVEMLGHDASFGYIKAVEMTASTNLVQKHVGYLACSLMLSPTHEFRFMIINQLQRDLQSSNHLEVCAALTAVCKLMTVEMIPAVQPMILDLLRHDAELVRKKAVMALHRFHQLQPEAMSDVDQALRRALCDRDPSVMGASLCLLHDICVQTPGAYKDLVPSFVSILKQITEHRLPREFDYHRIPAPWIQIRLLKLLALLGQADQQTSEGMYEVLHDVMRRADTGINVGYAIIYECVQTVTSIYPNSTLLDAAAASISRFISSENHNLKYLGVTGLAAIVKDHPRYAAQHQMAVIDCLEDPDETLKRKTLDLLYRMTNPVNVEFISDKLTQFLREATDVFLRRDLVSRITQCAERYAPSNAWYIQTMTNVFELGGELVEPEVAHNLLRLIAEGSGEDEEQDMELRRDAVDTYLDLLEQPKLPDLLVRTMAWVLGEYGYLSDVMPQEELCERMCELVDRPFDDEDMTRGYVLSAVTKITAQMGHSIDAADALMHKYKLSRSSDLQQRCFEYLAMTRNPQVMTEVYPEDASCEDIEIDPNMPFLSAFVEQALANGAPAYDPPEDSDEDEDFASRSKGAQDGLNFEAYQKPEMPYAMKPPPQQPDPTANRWGQHQLQSTQSQPPQDQAAGFGAPRNPRGNVWGPSGLSNPNESADQYPPASQPPPMDVQPPVQPQNMYAQPPPANTYGYSGGYVDEDVSEDLSEHEEVDQPVDERQVMASALFGGISGGPAPATTAAPRRSPGGRPPRRTSGTARQPVRRQSGRQELSHSQSSNPSAPPQQPQPNLDIDLLDMTFDSAPPQQPPTQAPSQSSDPFGMTSSNPPVQTAYSPVSSEPSVSSSQPSQAMPSQDPFNMAGLASSINDPPQSGDPFNMTGTSSGMPSMSTGMPGEMTSSMHSANLGISMGSGSGEFEYQGRTLEPWQITTQDFGGRWGACPCERKIKVTFSTVHTLDEFATRARQFNVHLVEAIPATNEAIAAGRLANSEHVVLIHVKVRNGGFLDLTVRTADMGLTEQLLESFSQRLH